MRLTGLWSRRRLAVAIVATGMLGAMSLAIMPAEAAPTRFEAENATISQGIVEANHTGFSGTGFVNYDNVVGSGVAFAVTGSWDTWQTKSVIAALDAGTNSIRATATGAAGGPNVDWLEVDMSAGNVLQAENATLSQAVVATNHTGFTGTGFVDYNNVTGSFVEWTVN